MRKIIGYKPVTVRSLSVPIEERTCDKCGIVVSHVDPDGTYAHELWVALDEDECVSFVRQRDYCSECLEPIWQAICTLINSDPDRPGYDPEDV
jgi:hypothetical protein